MSAPGGRTRDRGVEGRPFVGGLANTRLRVPHCVPLPECRGIPWPGSVDWGPHGGRLPHITQPLAATQVARPFRHPGWVYEEKVDGWQVLAYKDAAGVRLMSG